MPETSVVLAVVALLVGLASIVLLFVVLGRLRGLADDRDTARREAGEHRTALAVLKAQGQDLERDLKQDLAIARGEHQAGAQTLRAEVGQRLSQFTGATQAQVAALTQAQSEQLRSFGERLAQFTQTTQQQLAAANAAQSEQARIAGERIAQLSLASEARLEAVRLTVEQRLDLLRNENAKKLDEMRATVDEKLQATLETRLGESFKLVSDRLEQVHKGLGEMQNLAAGVGDLKRVLTNVKTRGTWGEVQLGALLAEMLTPQQYEANVATRPGSDNRVEFAIRLPGRADGERPCWLPIDCKFPLEDWQRLQDALERADAPAAEDSRKALATFLREQAKKIRTLYVEPPHTTDFAVLFVPTESLYAEMMARAGFADALQREHRVLLTGPMNLAALLNSLQMGFRTLAIEQRSSEVWKLLGAVKTEFGKFGDVLVKTKERLDKASDEIEKAGVRSRAIARELRKVEALPEPEAVRLLGPTLVADEDEGREAK